MSKKKSIVLIVILAIIMAVLTVMTFAKFTVPFYKNGTYKFNSILSTISLDQDMEEGIAYDLTLKENLDVINEDIVIEDVIKTLKTRLNALGYENGVVNAFRESDTEDYSLRVQMRKTSSYAEDIKVIAAYGTLAFYDGNGNELMNGEKGVKSSKYVSVTSEGKTSYYVQLKFTDEGYKILSDAIKAAEKEFTLTIKIGSTEVFSNKLSEDYIHNKTIAITSGTMETAKQLALQISSGGIAYEYEISDPYTISPTLGENASKLITWAIVVMVILVFALLIIFFKGYGVIADLAIFAYMLIYLLLMILVPGIIMNFGGIIGIAISIFITTAVLVDIMRKVQYEYKNGKTIKAAIKTAHGKSIFTVLEIDCILIALSLLLFFICGGYVKCFAITLGIGSAVSFFATVFFSRLLVAIFLPLLKGKSESFLKLKREAE